MSSRESWRDSSLEKRTMISILTSERNSRARKNRRRELRERCRMWMERETWRRRMEKRMRMDGLTRIWRILMMKRMEMMRTKKWRKRKRKMMKISRLKERRATMIMDWRNLRKARYGMRMMTATRTTERTTHSFLLIDTQRRWKDSERKRRESRGKRDSRRKSRESRGEGSRS
ncbi:hypothetical protein PMAYCL1PPCAC_29303, partial [Pristionchus mayeri]